MSNQGSRKHKRILRGRAGRSGQAMLEYILLMSVISTTAVVLGKTLIRTLNTGVLVLGATLEKDLKTGRLPVDIWNN